MEKFIIEIKEREKDYGSIPFWSFNGKLNSERLKKQIGDMHGLGMGGFFMHAREGLETEYLSDEWFSCIKNCVDEAKKLGMKAWVYDENGWPSGFAGGRMLTDDDYHAVYLHSEKTMKFPNAAYAVYSFDKGTPFLVREDIGEREYLAIYVLTDGTYVDTLRSDVTRKFIAETHEKYKKVVGNDFGDVMPGFFTDEPQYYRGGMPFSKNFEKCFFDKYGYPVTDAIPALYCDFDGARSLRYDYWLLVNERFTEGYIKTIYDWCNENGAMVTGHCIEEVSLYWQMLFCGGIMPFYEYQHIPGIDHLTRRLRTVLPAKQLGSVCAQLGKKKALSEMYAAVGWDATPIDLKRLAEMQYACGVNIMCQHLYPYSERGTRKRDYPLHFSEHNPWHRHLGEFNTYFSRLGAVLSMGEDSTDILVIHPIHSAYLDYTDMARVEGEASLGALDTDFLALYTKLSDSQIPYHLGDESIMRCHARISHDRTLVVGECKYNTVIIPAMDQLDASTAKLLSEFSNCGGKIYTYLSHKPTLVSGRTPLNGELDFLEHCCDIPTVKDISLLRENQDIKISVDSGILMACRKTDYGRIIFLTNVSENEMTNVKVEIRNGKYFEHLDLLSLNFVSVKGKTIEKGCVLSLDFEAGESYVLCERDHCNYLNIDGINQAEYIKLDSRACLAACVDNKLTLDRARVSFDGVDFSEERPIERIRDEILHSRYNGDVYICFDFDVKVIPQEICAVIEKNGVKSVCLNGHFLDLGENFLLEPVFSLTDIAPYIVEGSNCLILKMRYYQREHVYDVILGNGFETLRNSLSFDSEIEAVTLIGKFGVEADKAPSVVTETTVSYPENTHFAITSQSKTVLIDNIVESGFPFFAGEIRIKQSYDYTQGRASVLKLGGRFAVCEIFVNGIFAGKLMLGRKIDLAKYLREGKNELELRACFGNRNLLGPHHCMSAEPLGVGTRDFDFEGQWKNGICTDFYYGYNFVKSGLFCD